MHRKFKRLAKALIRLSVSESLLVAHITLLGILCRGSFVAVFFFKGATMHVAVGVWLRSLSRRDVTL